MKEKQKEPELNFLTVQFFVLFFFCPCWEICHHTPTYYLELGKKRVDARSFSRL